MTKPRYSKSQSGIVLPLTAMFMVVMVPMIGLAIDASMLYVVKTRLQGAVDGAALAGAKALSQGSTETLQEANATTAANTYIRLNYPSSFFFSQDVVVNPTTGVQIDNTVLHQRTVTVNASVIEPTMFMRWFPSMTSTTLAANAATVRKDLNLVLAMDRSGSLASTNTCAPLLAAAQIFVNEFSPGRDQLGLVTFAGTTNVNFAPATTFQSATPSIVTILQNTSCDGSTSTAEGLWRGYQQLVSLNQATSLNVLVLFSDGEPTAVHVNMPIKSGSLCTASPYTAGAPSGPGGYALPTGAKGYIPGIYNSYTNASEFFGIVDPTGPGAPNSTTGANTTPDNVIYTIPTCASRASDPTNVSDFTGLPNTDIFGNALNSGYKTTTANSTGMIDLGSGEGQVIANAQNMAFNAADSAALRIRHGATDNTVGAATNGHSLAGIVTYSIGLDQGLATYPFSYDFMARVANDPSATNYDATYPAGKFFQCNSPSDLIGAFQSVASQVLRLAR